MSSPLHQPIDPTQFVEIFKPRDPAGHKGTFGSAAIVGGATGMTGAAILAARSALKSGAGRVYVGLAQQSPDLQLDWLQPELMFRQFESLMTLASQMTAWGVGCGLGADAYGLYCLKTVFRERGSTPLVVDADALNALARGDVSADWGEGTVVLTPHPAEAARLLGTTVQDVNANRPDAAQTLAKQYNAWVVLKGQYSVVCNPAQRYQTNPTGNVALATAGSGDVLTGLMTSLLAQGFEADVAVPAAVWLHGAAADQLVNDLGGNIGLTAGEFIEAIRFMRSHSPT